MTNQILKQAAKLLGSKGGTMTKKRHGYQHYKKLADNMNAKIAERKKWISGKKQAQKAVKSDPLT